MSEAGKIERTRTTVTINGQQYTIVSQEGATHVKEVAKYVDQKMKEIRKLNPMLDTTRLSVLTALNVTDEYVKMTKRIKQLEAKLKEEEETDV
ncbi:cell division protein ZapA [Alkalihalobacterium alkalinitrilicum]|uniref:cell division protein ZapA n=1 Tax=Alkalihalobacterium alkalinitrilicum TaxID=427920 RepID=UPI0009957672|nr:cell division protein ZapA [Alkalihalobacterium alkalinitrilicum]